jgi:hypothetical protein
MDDKNFSDMTLAEIEALEKALAVAKKNRLNNPQSAVGRWKINTENDVEGRTTLCLGTFYGHLGDILLACSPETYYTLTPTYMGEYKVNGDKEMDAVHLPGWCLNQYFNADPSDDRLPEIQRFFGPRFVVNRYGNGYEITRKEGKVPDTVQNFDNRS